MANRESTRKCDTCRYNSSDYRGNYCGCSQNSEYGLYSIYGWCEHYEQDIRFGGDDGDSKRKKFYIQDMNLTFDKPITRKEVETLFQKALHSIGVIERQGCVN